MRPTVPLILFAVALAPLAAPALAQSAAGASHASVATARIDSAALQRLVRAAEAAHSDALVLWHDGRPVGAWYFGRPRRRIEAMSATKSIVGLAIGRLVATGALESIDDPVHRYFPEWKQGRKQRITIRHLLDHTSGLQDLRSTSPEVERAPDGVQLGLAAEISDEPGTRFFYSNKAVNLLAGIVQRVSGKRMDVFLREDLFAALGITDFDWTLDKAGNAYAYAGLQIQPEDMAKLGQLVLDRGEWKGRRLIAREWFDEMDRATRLEPRAGLLWWRIPERRAWIIDDAQLRALTEAGVDTAFVRRAGTIRGRYESLQSYEAALRGEFGARYWEPIGAALGPARANLARSEYGRMVGYEANGYLGQYVVVYPAERLVAVRMIVASDRYRPETDSFEEFAALVRTVVR